MQTIYDEEFRVRWQDADMFGKVKLSAICNYLQETAGRHANSLGFGFDEAKSRNQLWVIVGMYVRIYNYPVWEDTVRVETWPVKTERLLAFRDFRVYNDKGTVMAAASSSWMVLDSDRRRPQKLDIVEGIKTYSRDDDYGQPDPEFLPHLQEGKPIHSVIARFNEIDFNGHVNNTHYIDWCIDAMPVDSLRDHPVSTLNINFLSEVHAGEEVTILKERDAGPEELIEGRRKNSDKPAFRARIERKDIR